MDAPTDHASPHRPRRLRQRLISLLRRHTEQPTRDSPGAQRIDAAAPDWNPTVQPAADGPQDWSDVGAARAPISRRPGSEPLELPDSRAEPGGVPVYADPAMVTPAAAEKMRPLFRRSRSPQP